MTSGSRSKPTDITVEALRMAVRRPALTLIYVIPPALIPYAGQDRLLNLSLTVLVLFARCGVYGSFTARARGETGTAASLFGRSIARFALRYFGLGMLFMVPFGVASALIAYKYATPDNLLPVTLAVTYPAMVMVTVAVAILFYEDTGVFDAAKEMFAYIPRVWPVMIIIGAGTLVSIWRYYTYGNALPVGLDPVPAFNYLVTAFLELLGFLYASANMGMEGSRHL